MGGPALGSADWGIGESLWGRSWKPEYEACIKFGPILKAVEVGGQEWPEGYRYKDEKLFQ